MSKIYAYEKERKKNIGDVMFIVHENETYFVFKNCKQKQNVYINQQYELRDIYI